MQVLIDYLTVIFRDVQPSTVLQWIRPFLGNPQAIDQPNKGINGYENRIHIEGCGFIGYGGANQRGTIMLSLTGSGTARIRHIEGLIPFLESNSAKITRIDIAADDIDGDTISVDKAIEGYRAGDFTLSGRPPKCQHIDDFGSGDGRTFYVGTRAAGKLMRFYEKGKQLGDKASKWLRAELELRAVDRVIPYETLRFPGKYLRGANRFCERLAISDAVSKIKTIRRATEITINAVRSWLKQAAGKSLNVLAQVEGGDFAKVFFDCRRDGVPARLHSWIESSRLCNA